MVCEKGRASRGEKGRERRKKKTVELESSEFKCRLSRGTRRRGKIRHGSIHAAVAAVVEAGAARRGDVAVATSRPRRSGSRPRPARQRARERVREGEIKFQRGSAERRDERRAMGEKEEDEVTPREGPADVEALPHDRCRRARQTHRSPRRTGLRKIVL